VTSSHVRVAPPPTTRAGVGSRARRRFGLGLAVAGLFVACATPPPSPPEPARVEVVVARGIAEPALPPARVALVLDAGRSMAASASANATRLDAAAQRARQLIAGVAANARVSVHAVGASGSQACSAPVELVAPGPAAAAHAGRLDDLAPGGEADLAGALARVGEGLRSAGTLDGARFVVLTDLEGGCGGDLCAALGGLAEGGASVDLVVLGGRPTPACVSTVAAPARPVPAALAPEPPGFAVSTRGVDGAAPATTRGTAGSGPVAAAPGSATLRIDLDPPLDIGPLTLEPGSLTRVRVIDFPDARPPVRDWSLEVIGEGGTLAGTADARTP